MRASARAIGLSRREEPRLRPVGETEFLKRDRGPKRERAVWRDARRENRPHAANVTGEQHPRALCLFKT